MPSARCFGVWELLVYLPVAVGGVSWEMPVIGRWLCISGFLRWRLFGECEMGAFLRTVVRDARLNP